MKTAKPRASQLKSKKITKESDVIIAPKIMTTLFDPNNKFWANDTSRFGFKMMEKMGWSPGKGLGVNEDGETKSLPVKVKEDNKGVGCVQSDDQAWVITTHEYNGVLQDLQLCLSAKEREKSDSGKIKKRKEKTNQSEKRKEKKNSKTLNAGEESEPQKHKKEKRKEKKRKEKSKIENEKNTKTPVLKTHAHFIPSRVVAGKRVSNYSQQDLDAIFGTASFSALPSRQTVKADTLEDGISTVTSKTNIKDYFDQKNTKRKFSGPVEGVMLPSPRKKRRL